MYRSELCKTILSERDKTNHNQTKKHKYYSNLILNRYVIKNVEVSKIKDVFNPYSIEQTNKFKFFTVCVNLIFDVDDYENPSKHKITVSSYITYNIQSEHYTTYTTKSASDFLYMVIVEIYLSHKCSTKIIPEIGIVFISDLINITKEHYLEQPKSMICRKLIRRFHVSPQDFEYKWLPDSFKHLYSFKHDYF